MYTATIALLFLLTVSPVWARPAFHWTTTEGTFVSVDYLSFEDSGLDTSDGEIGGPRSTGAGQFAFDTDHGWVAGLGHEYNALDIEAFSAAPPQTNGDLHTLHLATQWHTPVGGGELRLAAAPAISVSSNGLKNPDELGRDSLQLWGAALYQWPGSLFDWVLGVAQDYRFGERRVYPLVGIEWQSERIELRAVYPDIELAWMPTSHWLLTTGVTPDGNVWQAFDRELEHYDEFRREAWQAQLGIAYQFSNGIRLGGIAGLSWDQQWRFRRQDGSLARLDSEDSAFFGLHLGWYRLLSR